jgi:hypothetical protein
MNWISRVICDIREQYVSRGFADDFEDINRGNCENFAVSVIDEIREQSAEGDVPEIEFYEICSFFEGQGDDECVEEYGPLDRTALSIMLPDMSPPGGRTWEQLDRIVGETEIGWGLHTFMICEGRVYDSEAPEGVPGIFDLPFYERYLAKRGYGSGSASPNST